jgi:outer membrane receptor protein involved in Fe transport
VEFEVRKNLGFAWSGVRHWNITGNYIYAESESTIPASIPLNFYPLKDKRPLVGQPENMVNLALEYDNPDWGFTARFMYQYTDERVDQIAGNNLPNIIEKEHDRFDLVLIKTFGKHWDVKFTAQNLNNEPYTLTQGGQLHYTYKEGRTFKLGVSWKW